MSCADMDMRDHLGLPHSEVKNADSREVERVARILMRRCELCGEHEQDGPCDECKSDAEAAIAAMNEWLGETALKHVGNHTPGPWKLYDGLSTHGHFRRGRSVVATTPCGSEYIVAYTDFHTPEIAEANARLIASAPTLSAEKAELREALIEGIELALAAEREACAKIADYEAEEHEHEVDRLRCRVIAAAIRARTKGEGA